MPLIAERFDPVGAFGQKRENAGTRGYENELVAPPSQRMTDVTTLSPTPQSLYSTTYLSLSCGLVPTAAPTKSRPSGATDGAPVAGAPRLALNMDLVARATRLPSLSMIGSFPVDFIEFGQVSKSGA